MVRVAARFTKTLYLVRYQQLIPPPDLVLSVIHSEQETSVAAQHNRLPPLDTGALYDRS